MEGTNRCQIAFPGQFKTGDRNMDIEAWDWLLLLVWDSGKPGNHNCRGSIFLDQLSN